MSVAPGSTATVPTRDRIVDAALRLFSERGTTAVSMRELADAADLTVPGLYYHFTSKAELIREVYRARLRGRGEIPAEPGAGRGAHRRRSTTRVHAVHRSTSSSA